MRYVSETLRFVNEVRALLGMGPIKTLHKGDPGRPWDCPVAQSLRNTHNVAVSSSSIVLRNLTPEQQKRFPATSLNPERYPGALGEKPVVTYKRGNIIYLATPAPVRSFIAFFDRGYLPQYMTKKAQRRWHV